MKNNLLIHHVNVVFSDIFDNQILFKLSSGDIDRYITDTIIPKIQKVEFDILYIKDSLSSNYLELYGLRLAYHIRLSTELDDKRFVPIVILSDLDGCLLNELTSMAQILFTKNIFIAKNHTDTVKYFNSLTLDPFTKLEYKEKFLNLIEIEAPRDYLSDHGITNEWAIHQWSQTLGVSTPATEKNHNKISSMLYFKYLKDLHSANTDIGNKYKIKTLKNSGDILYIDDEWNKGWSDILKALFLKSVDTKFNTFEYNYEEHHKFRILGDIKNELLKNSSDVVILDLRLTKTDHSEVEDLNRYTGIKIVDIIKEINPGIQIIMLTATSQSIILEKLYDYGILGYIKKEHPDDLSIKTEDNIEKLFNLVDAGLERKYLKDIFKIQENILQLSLLKNAKLTIGEENKILELKNTINKIFNILNSNMQDKEIFSSLIIFKCIEIIIDFYTKEISTYDKNKYRYITKTYWKDTGELLDIKFATVENKIQEIFIHKLNINNNTLMNKIKKIICFRNYNSHSGQIKKRCEEILIKKPNEKHLVEWFGLLEQIIIQMNSQLGNER